MCVCMYIYSVKNRALSYLDHFYLFFGQGDLFLAFLFN